VAVQYNPAFGLQLNLLDIDTNFTLGQFEQQRKETLQRLLRDNPSFIRFEDGVFHTRNSDLPLNRVLQRIAVISSDTSAGYHDFRHTLDNNTFGYHFEIDDYFALVQGEGNAKQVLAQLIAVFDAGKAYDALVIIRGGGSQMDFLIFDNYELNRAIAKFPIPIITGIGHQKNETIADLMAHTSTKTPTKVAELLIAHNRAFENTLLSLQQQIVIRTFQMMNHHKEQINRLNQVTINSSRNLLHEKHRDILNLSGMIVTNPKIILSNKRRDLANLLANLRSFNRMYFINQARYIAHFESIVRLMSPQNILNKGFAIVKLNGVIVSDESQISPGSEMTITLAKAEINTKVLSKTSSNGKEFEL
jgi:exodeoxyribonuclease VII large subunit